jgi:hypothetical protein
MKKALALLLIAFALTACGGTSTGGGGGVAGTQGQETTDQPEAGGLRTPAYTSSHWTCSLLPLEELARQNQTKPTKTAVADKIASFETTKKAQGEARKGCLDALNTK